MQELRVIGIDGEALVVSAEDGEQFRVLIDDALRDAVRPRPHVRSEAPKVSPREIQQLIRAGRSAQQVVELTGAATEDVERFEGPVLAEREHIVEQARSVGVRLPAENDTLTEIPLSFGEVLDERLESLRATAVHWDAWKDAELGWRVGIDFTVDGIDREALWSFDPRARALAPSNPAAVTLSQQDDPAQLRAPRLRAVETATPASVELPASASASDAESSPTPADQRGAAWLGRAVAQIGGSTSPQDETADLLEQLRRRRGEREPHAFDPFDAADVDDEEEDDRDRPEPAGPEHDRDDKDSGRPLARLVARDPDAVGGLPEPANLHPALSGGTGSTPAAPVTGTPLPGLEASAAGGRGVAGATVSRGTGPLSRRRGRVTLPSWDEIVFGTRSDDD